MTSLTALKHCCQNLPTRQFERWVRVQAQQAGWSTVAKRCKLRELVSNSEQDRILADDGAGLFTGETLLHIAIQVCARAGMGADKMAGMDRVAGARREGGSMPRSSRCVDGASIRCPAPPVPSSCAVSLTRARLIPSCAASTPKHH